ncbi:MAG: hypothetical protein SNJ63_01225 [Sphingomonadaceae bacterium]
MAIADPLLEAWLRVVARDGFAGATIAAAAAEAGVPAAEFLAGAGDSFDCASAFLDRIARAAMLGAAGEGTVRDRLFDGIMAGFDVLQAHRGAVEALIASRDPGLVALAGAKGLEGTRRLAAAAGVDVTGLSGGARTAALAALLARALHAWRRDDSPDMAATMAALDQLLSDAARAAEEGPLSLLRARLPGLFRRGSATGPAPDPPAE